MAGGRQREYPVTAAQRLDTALEGRVAETPAINGAVLNLHNLHKVGDELRSEATGMRDDRRDARYSTMTTTTQVVQSQRGCSVQLLVSKGPAQPAQPAQPTQPTQQFQEEEMSKEWANRDTRVQKSFRSGCDRWVGCADSIYLLLTQRLRGAQPARPRLCVHQVAASPELCFLSHPHAIRFLMVGHPFPSSCYGHSVTVPFWHRVPAPMSSFTVSLFENKQARYVHAGASGSRLVGGNNQRAKF